MRFNRLDLNLLVALDALLAECSISRAAEKVHASQSSMSHMLAKLREHFRDDLLIQVGRRMELTPRAEMLRDPIRDVLMRIRTTIDVDPEFDPAASDRQFTLHLSDYSMEILFPWMLELAEAQRSRVRFKLMPQVGHAHRSLERGEVDLLLIPQAFGSGEHPCEPVFEENFVALVWQGSRHAERELTMERYIDARHIVMEPPGSGNPAYEGWFVQRYGISRTVQVSTYSFTAMPALVVGTEMIATVHARIAGKAVKHLPVKAIALPLEMPPVVQIMQWHKHRTHDPGLAWLRQLIVDASKRMDDERLSL